MYASCGDVHGSGRNSMCLIKLLKGAKHCAAVVFEGNRT